MNPNAAFTYLSAHIKSEMTACGITDAFNLTADGTRVLDVLQMSTKGVVPGVTSWSEFFAGETRKYFARLNPNNQAFFANRNKIEAAFGTRAVLAAIRLGIPRTFTREHCLRRIEARKVIEGDNYEVGVNFRLKLNRVFIAGLARVNYHEEFEEAGAQVIRPAWLLSLDDLQADPINESFEVDQRFFKDVTEGVYDAIARAADRHFLEILKTQQALGVMVEHRSVQ